MLSQISPSLTVYVLEQSAAATRAATGKKKTSQGLVRALHGGVDGRCLHWAKKAATATAIVFEENMVKREWRSKRMKNRCWERKKRTTWLWEFHKISCRYLYPQAPPSVTGLLGDLVPSLHPSVNLFPAQRQIRPLASTVELRLVS